MNRRHLTFMSSFLLLGAAGITAWADSITVNGKLYSGAIVRESNTRYYIANPADGTAISIAKSEMDPGTLVISPATERAALQRQWEDQAGFSQKDAARQRQSLGGGGQSNSAAPTPIRITGPPQPAHDANTYVTNGMVGHIELNNIPLRDALDATLRPLNLTYETDNNYLFITSAERARNEAAAEATEARAYSTNDASDTLPKILVQNPGGGGGGSFGGSMGGGGIGGGGIGQGGFGGGGFGGGGGLGGGGVGGGGLGGGGFGGGAGGVGGTVQISNISQLFTTIDDRLVGETPAIIGMSVSGGQTAMQQNQASQGFGRNGRQNR